MKQLLSVSWILLADWNAVHEPSRAAPGVRVTHVDIPVEETFP